MERERESNSWWERTDPELLILGGNANAERQQRPPPEGSDYLTTARTLAKFNDGGREWGTV